MTTKLTPWSKLTIELYFPHGVINRKPLKQLPPQINVGQFILSDYFIFPGINSKC